MPGPQEEGPSYPTQSQLAPDPFGDAVSDKGGHYTERGSLDFSFFHLPFGAVEQHVSRVLGTQLSRQRKTRQAESM